VLKLFALGFGITYVRFKSQGFAGQNNAKYAAMVKSVDENVGCQAGVRIFIVCVLVL
jgi:hypothetical protein